MEERYAIQYWNSQVPVRILFLFLLTAYIYLAPATSDIAYALKNGLTFSWAFLESATWFLAFLSLREENRATRTKA
jgi:hypothetical protein